MVGEAAGAEGLAVVERDRPVVLRGRRGGRAAIRGVSEGEPLGRGERDGAVGKWLDRWRDGKDVQLGSNDV